MTCVKKPIFGSQRDWMDVIVDILRSTSKPRLELDIMYETKFYHPKNMHEHLQFLLNTELLIAYDKNGETYYERTEKGTKLIRSYKKLENLVNL